MDSMVWFDAPPKSYTNNLVFANKLVYIALANIFEGKDVHWKSLRWYLFCNTFVKKPCFHEQYLRPK